MAAGIRLPRRVVRLAFGVAVAVAHLMIARAVAGQTDATPPAVSISSPAAGTVVTGTVTATAEATDNVGVAGVQLKVDGVPLGPEALVGPYTVNWNTRGSADLVFGVVKVTVGPMTIAAGSGLTKRLGVSCPTCAGDDTVSVDKIQSAPGAASAAFTFSTPAHYFAHMAAFKAAAAPGYLQGAAATSNTGSTTIAKAFGSPITAGSLLVVAVAWTGNVPLTVTDSRNNVYAVATTAYDAVLGQSLAIVYAANVTAGATTVTARFGTSSPKVRRLEIHEYAGMATTNPLDGTATNMAAGTTTPGSVTSGSATTTVTAAAANGSHTLTAVARDAAGNQTTSVPVTITVSDDTTPPVISNVTVSSITAFGATINWTTNEPGTSQVNYGPTATYGSTTALNAALVTAHTVSLSGLAGSTLYHISVRSNDGAGNLALSGDLTFTTLDGTAPTASITAPTGGATVSASIPIAASASDNVGVAGVQFRLDGAALGAEATASPYSASWNTTTATNGTHALTAIARDAAGNQTTSVPITVTVNNDTTPPLVSAVTASTITAAGALITWTTDEPSDSQVDSGLTTAYGSTTALNATLVTTHAVSLSGLSDGTLYHVRVRSRDAAGNLAVSSDVTFTTLDATAPAVSITVPGSGATVSGMVTATATASDNVGVAGVQFRLDGAALGAEATASPYSASWNTTTATNGTHTLTAIARDTAGNQTTSAPITITVNNDTTPPLLSAVTASTITASGALITWTTDEPSDSQVDSGLTTAYGSTTALNEALVTTHAVSLSGLTDGTLYHVRVRSRDAAGNVAVSGDVTFTTLDNTPPSVSITAPAGGTTISGTATLSATATDNVGISSVQFALDGVNFGAEITAAPYGKPWMTPGSSDLVFGVVKVAVGPMTISAGTGLTKRLGVSCPTCTGDDTVTVDGVQSAPGPATATFTFSAPAHYLAHVAAFKAATAPVYVQGAAATSNVAATSLAQAFAAPVSAGALLVGAVAWSGTAPLTMTDSQGNSYAVAVTAYDTVLNQTLAIVYASNARAGATIVTAGFGALSPAVRRLEIHEYAGMATIDALDGTATNSTDGTTASDAISTGTAQTTVTAPVANGIHTLTAVARDASGNTATAPPVTVTVFNDAIPPTVSLASPAAGTIVMGTVTVAASAADNGAVAGVQFAIDGAALGAEDTTAPYSVSWNTATASNGSHTLAAVARDAAGNLATSSVITVTVSNDLTAPVISAVAISSVLSLGATISWTTDEVSNSEVEYGLTTAYGAFSTLNVSLATAHSVFVINLVPSTVYHFRARSRDVAGNLALSSDFTFATLDGILPSVSITAPASGSTVSGTVAMAANATDNIGVAGVEFQVDGVTISAEDTLAPYAIAWNTTAQPAGFHTLTAVARDMAGNQKTSGPVIVTVANAAGQIVLAWDASIDPDLSGYKVYIGAASGVYALNAVDVGNVSSYTITGLQAGGVYYVAVASYAEGGNEGGFSNEVSATIP